MAPQHGGRPTAPKPTPMPRARACTATHATARSHTHSPTTPLNTSHLTVSSSRRCNSAAARQAPGCCCCGSTSRRLQESALSHGAFSLRARASMSSLPGRSFGVAKPHRRPRSLTLRAGKNSYQLALDVSSRRAADRSPTEQDGRRAESIGINSQAVGTTHSRTTCMARVSWTHRRVA